MIAIVPLLAAGFGEVLGIVVGVILALGGMAVAVMAISAMIEGAVRRGAYALVAGLIVLAVGLWMIGVVG